MTGTSRIVHVMVTSLATVQLPGMLHKHRRSGRQHYTASSLLQLSWDVAQLAELPLICTHSQFQGLSQDNLLDVLTLLHSPTLNHRTFTNALSRQDLNVPPSDYYPYTEVNVWKGPTALFRRLT